MNDSNINTQDEHGWTALHWAIRNNHIEIATILLQSGASVEVGDDNGRTPLHVAASRGQEIAIPLLLKHGAYVDARENSEWTPLHFATSNGRLESVKVLAAAGANLEATCTIAQTPLLKSLSEFDFIGTRLQQRKERVALWLLDQEINLCAKDSHGQVPLHYSAQAGLVSIAQLLLNKGADIQPIEARNGRTPLHLAAVRGHLKMVSLLLKHGSNPDITDKNGNTALDLAERNNHYSVMQELRLTNQEKN